jgi:hypothetical protein
MYLKHTTISSMFKKGPPRSQPRPGSMPDFGVRFLGSVCLGLAVPGPAGRAVSVLIGLQLVGGGSLPLAAKPGYDPVFSATPSSGGTPPATPPSGKAGRPHRTPRHSGDPDGAPPFWGVLLRPTPRRHADQIAGRCRRTDPRTHVKVLASLLTGHESRQFRVQAK